MSPAKPNKKTEKPTVDTIENRKARYDYHLGTRYEAGIVLKGVEVKAIREGKMNLQDSFVKVWKDEAWLYNCHISHYSHKQGHMEIDPLLTRKLLLNRKEINELAEWSERKKGATIVPVKAYFKKGKLKVEIAFAEGKKQYDKRETIKKRMQDREAKAAIKRSR